MLIALLALALTALPQQPASTQPSDLAVISARLGTCSADFTVTDADGRPEYAAIIHVRIRYGFLAIKRVDLEVGTNSDGKARVEGLPLRGNTLNYEISKGERRATVQQDVRVDCRAEYEVTLD
jgi:hypothetical protein